MDKETLTGRRRGAALEFAFIHTQSRPHLPLKETSAVLPVFSAQRAESNFLTALERPCSGLDDEHGPHNPCLNIWSPIEGTGREGLGVAFLRRCVPGTLRF